MTVIETPGLTPRENWAVVKVQVAPMCAEYKGFVAGHANDCLGHEAAGEVVAVAQPGRVAVGDRVVVMPQYPCGTCALCVSGDYIYCENALGFGTVPGSATMAQFLIKPDWLLLPIPDDLSYERASLACCALGPSFGALETARVGPSDSVLIAGCGPVGFGAIVNARFRGARALVVESHPWRVARARAMGVDEIYDPRDPDLAARIRAATGGHGVDVALDCAGAVAAQRLCIDVTRRLGMVLCIGECGDTLTLRSSPDLIRKGLTLRGSWHYNLTHYPKIIDVIRRSPLVEQLVSHVFPMRDAQEAFTVSASGGCAKVLLQPWA